MVLLSTMLTLVRCLIKRVDYRHVWGHADCVLKRCLDDRSMWGSCWLSCKALMTYLCGVMLVFL